jgi:hypothetical protein
MSSATKPCPRRDFEEFVNVLITQGDCELEDFDSFINGLRKCYHKGDLLADFLMTKVHVEATDDFVSMKKMTDIQVDDFFAEVDKIISG